MEKEKKCVSIGLSIRNDGTQQKWKQIEVVKHSIYPSILYNLRRFAYIVSWIGPGNTLSLKRYRIVIPQATTLFLIEKNPDVESAFREKRRRRTGAPPYCILNRTEHSDYIRHRSILVRNNYCITIKIRFEMTNPYTTNFDFSNRL